MAYQNVGTPRFYVDKLSYVKALGAGTGTPNGVFDFNPSNQVTKPANEMQGFQFNIPNNFPLGKLNFYALLGHTFNGKKGQIQHKDGSDSATYWSANAANHFTYNDIAVNIYNENGYPQPANNGFSIGGLDVDGDDYPLTKSIMWYYEAAIEGNVDTDATLGAFLVGEYYNMPHSPDLNLKLTYEYDGVKPIQTKNGSTLSNAMYTKPADWGSQGAWQLGDNQNYRTGRRTWDLSFSYLADTDVFPVNASQSHSFTIGSEDGYHTTTNNPTTGFSDIAADGVSFSSNILDGQDFFSQVWNKTLGNALPFIFQPDNTNSNPDQFAICKFVGDTLQYDQVSPNVYNIKLKIEEVW